MQPGIHIGKAIRKQLDAQNISPPAFARILGKRPSAINYMLRKKHLHATLLIEISKLLKFNFFQLYVPELENQKTQYGKELDSIREQLKEQKRETLNLKRKNAHQKEIIDMLKEIAGGG